MLLVKKVQGPNTIKAGETAIFKAIAFNKSTPSETEKSSINWRLVYDSGTSADEKDWQNHGDTLSYKVPADKAGLSFAVMPYANSPSRNVCVITNVKRSSENILNDGFNSIRKEFSSLFNETEQLPSAHKLYELIGGLRFDLDNLLDETGSIEENEIEIEEPVDTSLANAKRLAIIVGHSKNRPGARAGEPLQQYEYTFNSEIAKSIERRGRDCGLAVQTFFRDDVGIAGAYRNASSYQPEAIIELHFNAATPAAHGAETLYSSVNPQSEKLAQLLQKSMCDALGSRDRGIKHIKKGGRGYGNVSASSLPSALVEPFFGSNTADCENAVEKKCFYVKGLVDAVLEFIKVEK